MNREPTEEERVLKDISLRIDSLRSEGLDEESRRAYRGGGVRGAGLGIRVIIELFAALIVGSVIGYSIDIWLGTLPLVMVVGFVLGSVAGIMNVIRLSKIEEIRQQRKDEELDPK